MLTASLGALGALYIFAGFAVWLNTAVAMIGDLSGDPYTSWLKEQSRKSALFEGLVLSYLLLLWPVHLTVKAIVPRTG